MTPKGKALNEYIALKKTQEECVGFIDGYDKALEDNKDKKYTEEDVENILIEYVKTNPSKPFQVVKWFTEFLRFKRVS
jgi:hypothetical protein